MLFSTKFENIITDGNICAVNSIYQDNYFGTLNS